MLDPAELALAAKKQESDKNRNWSQEPTAPAHDDPFLILRQKSLLDKVLDLKSRKKGEDDSQNTGSPADKLPSLNNQKKRDGSNTSSADFLKTLFAPSKIEKSKKSRYQS